MYYTQETNHQRDLLFMPKNDAAIIQLFEDFICSSRDGYAIFSKEDVLLYANQAFADIFCLKGEQQGKVHFTDMVKVAFEEKRGINIESDDLNAWLTYVESVRRQREFRIFEVDLVDGRWMLFSEQILETGEMLVQTKDITSQKVIEDQLKSSIDELSQLALTDELTQLANRRSFVDSATKELARCQRKCEPSTMMLIDLDRFKSINDTYGHFSGDTVLKSIASTLIRTLREYDIIGRLGGEEFAIYLGQTDAELAKVVAERLRANIENTPVHCSGNVIHLTASIGCAVQMANSTFESLYTQADEALYRAKKQGRNRIEFAN